MSMIKPGPMPPKPKAKPRRGSPEWRQQKFDEARERKARRAMKGINRVRFPAHVERDLLAGRGPYRAKPRKRLKQRSPEKTRLHGLYVAALVFLIGLDPLCRCCRKRPATEGHHPWGQWKWLIFLFIPICRECHEAIESNKKAAREVGLIQPRLNEAGAIPLDASCAAGQTPPHG